MDETRRAKDLLAEGRNEEAERIARVAVETLDRGSEQALLAEALMTHGKALARLPFIDSHMEARSVLERAGAVAEHLGDAEGAGHAAMTMIEELSHHLRTDELAGLYLRADELLRGAQHPDTIKRLRKCARLVIDQLAAQAPTEDQSGDAVELSTPAESEGLSFKEKMRRYERGLIEQALRDAGGVVTRAAQLLGFKHHYSLVDLLNKRHRELRSARSPIVPRKRSIMRSSSSSRVQKSASQQKLPVRILHVEDNQLVAAAIKSTLEAEGWYVESYDNGTTALRKLSGDAAYDLLLLDNHLPGVSGIELTQIARKLPHRRRMPIIMLSAIDCETDAWRAGVDAFLRKPEDVLSITETIARLTNFKLKS